MPGFIASSEGSMTFFGRSAAVLIVPVACVRQGLLARLGCTLMLNRVRRPLLCAVLLTSSLPALAAPPPLQRELADWANAHAFSLKPRAKCDGIEEASFGASASRCWNAKAKAAQVPKSRRLHPRFVITVASFADEAAAKARLDRFTEVPRALKGEAGKTYPLRAGCWLGSQVVIVTTDAFAFEQDAYRTAAALAERLGGKGLRCWSRCPPG